MSSLRSPASLAMILLAAAPLCVGGAQPVNLRSEYLTDPLGLDSPSPRLSWVIESDLRGERQTACQDGPHLDDRQDPEATANTEGRTGGAA